MLENQLDKDKINKTKNSRTECPAKLKPENALKPVSQWGLGKPLKKWLNQQELKMKFGKGMYHLIRK